MNRLGEIAVFGLLSLAVHLAFLLGKPQAAGMVAQGSAGTETITLQALSGDLETLVETWTTAPEATDTLEQPDQSPPDPLFQPPAPPAPDTRPPAVAAMVRVLPPEAAQQEAMQRPAIDTQSHTPPAARQKPAPARQPRASAPSRAASRALGAGGGAQAGVNGTQQGNSLSKGTEQQLLAGWGQRVRTRILRNKPAMRGNPVKGTVRLGIVVAPSGQLVSARVIRSSGSSVLDKAALGAVHRAGRFPRAPRALRKPRYTFTLNMNFG